MGMIDKLMFWKKEPKLDLDTHLDMGPDPAPAPNFGMPQEQGYDQNLGMPSSGIDSGFQPQNYHQPYNPVSGPSAPSSGAFDQPRVVHDPIQSPQAMQSDSHEKNLEIISMKLDNIKAAIENMNQRLINIERLAVDSTRQQPRRPNW